jgi:hypothetical protein
VNTGAREALQGYYAALVRQDWPAAYAALHPDSRAKYNPERFAGLARQYRHGLGFEPEDFRVRSCEEHGEEAVAYVVLTSHDGARERSYKDAVTLPLADGGWGVVLPPRFGHEPGR